ncbi:MAG: gluconate 5-dehydrogenase [Planctomycetaceae bacterium]|nr:MAG: gluconate 5-dehydrogenase [Planctomycetaceae bacterium]
MDTLFDLTGKVALITGGSKGLGLAMAQGLAQAGAHLVICSRHREELEQAVWHITKGTAAQVKWFVADLTQREQTEQLARQALEAFGRLDILINNAGSNLPEPIDQVCDQHWDRLLELNLTSCMVLSRAVVPAMKAQRWGRIVHLSSIMALASKEGRNAYSATKAALIGMTRAMALELGPYNITVNCLAPGPFLTDLPASVLSSAERQKFAERTALGRWGQPQELVGPVLLLASDAGSYITGTTLVVDGGVLCRAF